MLSQGTPVLTDSWGVACILISKRNSKPISFSLTSIGIRWRFSWEYWTIWPCISNVSFGGRFSDWSLGNGCDYWTFLSVSGIRSPSKERYDEQNLYLHFHFQKLCYSSKPEFAAVKSKGPGVVRRNSGSLFLWNVGNNCQPKKMVTAGVPDFILHSQYVLRRDRLMSEARFWKAISLLCQVVISAKDMQNSIASVSNVRLTSTRVT